MSVGQTVLLSQVKMRLNNYNKMERANNNNNKMVSAINSKSTANNKNTMKKANYLSNRRKEKKMKNVKSFIVFC
jgi:hypothetical protein